MITKNDSLTLFSLKSMLSMTSTMYILLCNQWAQSVLLRLEFVREKLSFFFLLSFFFFCRSHCCCAHCHGRKEAHERRMIENTSVNKCKSCNIAFKNNTQFLLLHKNHTYTHFFLFLYRSIFAAQTCGFPIWHWQIVAREGKPT